MKITYHGHSCFSIESNGYSVVTDPYAGVDGIEMPKLSANAVYCSHEHFDHNYREGVELIDGVRSSIFVSLMHVFHDDQEGALRGLNDIMIFSAEDKKVVHMGDIGHDIPDELVAALGHVDVLMIPVGGFFTIDAYQAVSFVRRIDPDIIIPMHYRDGKIGFDKIATVEDFISLLTVEEQKKLRLVKGYGESIEL